MPLADPGCPDAQTPYDYVRSDIRPGPHWFPDKLADVSEPAITKPLAGEVSRERVRVPHGLGPGKRLQLMSRRGQNRPSLAILILIADVLRSALSRSSPPFCVPAGRPFP